MKLRIVLVFAVFCCTLSSSFPDAVVAPAVAQGISADRYHCPMHPSIVQDRKGDCPICGMKLVPIQEPSGSAAPGAVAASADRQKILGIVVSAVQRSEGTRALRFVGRVMPDEKRVFKINGGIEGSIRDVAPVTTGSRVKKDQVLGSFWAPNALSIIQLFIINVAGKEYAVQRQTEGKVEGDGSATLGYANIQQRIMQ